MLGGMEEENEMRGIIIDLTRRPAGTLTHLLTSPTSSCSSHSTWHEQLVKIISRELCVSRRSLDSNSVPLHIIIITVIMNIQTISVNYTHTGMSGGVLR